MLPGWCLPLVQVMLGVTVVAVPVWIPFWIVVALTVPLTMLRLPVTVLVNAPVARIEFSARLIVVALSVPPLVTMKVPLPVKLPVSVAVLGPAIFPTVSVPISENVPSGPWLKFPVMGAAADRSSSWRWSAKAEEARGFVMLPETVPAERSTLAVNEVCVWPEPPAINPTLNVVTTLEPPATPANVTDGLVRPLAKSKESRPIGRYVIRR